MTQLKTMYPGVANSPDTFLVEGLTIDGTVMYVADAAVFGEIPTLAVIGQAELAETVQVTGKQSDGGLTIVRGVEGKRQAWAKATNVARNWTNKDYEALRANITAINDGKVDKIEGKGLSTHDYTDAAKAKVDAIPPDPKYTDTVPDLTPYATKDALYDEYKDRKSDMEKQSNAIQSIREAHIADIQSVRADYAKDIKTAKDTLTVDINNAKTAHNADVQRLESQKLNKADVVNDLSTPIDTVPLSAEQGMVLDQRKLNKTDVVNDLTTGGVDKALSAEQGKTLFTYADNGKKSIADAIVGKGVSATKSDSFNTLADKISKIKTGYGMGDVLPEESVQVQKTYVGPKDAGSTGMIGRISGVAIGSDGSIYAATVKKVYKISGDKTVWTYTSDFNFLSDVAIGPNGIYCSGDEWKIIKISTSGQKVREITGFSGPVACMAVGPDGWIYCGSAGMDYKIFKISESGSRTEIATITDFICGLAFGPNGMLYVGDRSGKILKISNTGQKSEVMSLADTIGGLAVGADGSIYAASGETVYKISNGRKVWEFTPGNDTIYNVAIGPDGLIYAGGSLVIYKISDSHYKNSYKIIK
jgi:hypothetical protein